MNLEKTNIAAHGIAKKHFKQLKKEYKSMLDSGLSQSEVKMATLLVLSYLTDAHADMQEDKENFYNAFGAVLKRAKSEIRPDV